MNLSLILLALGPGQIVLIALAIILLFGVNKIPQLMKGLGKGIKDFKEEMKDDSKIEDGKEKWLSFSYYHRFNNRLQFNHLVSFSLGRRKNKPFNI